MKKIFKYQLASENSQTIKMPVGAKPLFVAEQQGAMCLWALVDPEVDPVQYTIRIFGTGHPIEKPDTLTYIGTIVLSGGSLIFHVFVERGVKL